jgi:hypothetical protein
MSKEKKKAFEEAGSQSQSNLVSEFIQFLKHSKKFWLLPLIVGLLIFGLLIALGGTAVAPFIYSLF